MSSARSTFQPITGLLAATDLQHGSDAVLRTAAEIAAATGARLHVAYVLTPDSVPDGVRRRDPDAEDDVLEEARRGLWLQADALRPLGVDIASVVVVRRRSVHEGIVEIARSSGVDLIVMGSHARSTTSYRLGSTTDRVVQTTSVPCLVVRGEWRFPMHRVAALTDFTAAARVGLQVAYSWLPALGLADPEGRLDVVHVAWPAPPPGEGPPRRVLEKLEREIAVSCQGAPHAPARSEPRVLFSAYPADAVVEDARGAGHQLVVVATHGKGAVARALVGSVALGLMHAAPCPVLVVPPQRRRR